MKSVARLLYMCQANAKLEKQLAFKAKKLQTIQREYEIQREILATERQAQMPKFPGAEAAIVRA
jgi:hypothetical protein